MIKSMTGFGRAEVITKERKITVELKSVNHRYLDLSIKMPRKLSFLESTVRNLLKKYIQRGKVDVFISYEDYTLSQGSLKYNRELAAEYDKCLFRIHSNVMKKVNEVKSKINNENEKAMFYSYITERFGIFPERNGNFAGTNQRAKE